MRAFMGQSPSRGGTTGKRRTYLLLARKRFPTPRKFPAPIASIREKDEKQKLAAKREEALHQKLITLLREKKYLAAPRHLKMKGQGGRGKSVFCFLR